MKNRVSVVIPYKDGSAALQTRDCIKSLLTQTILPYEIIVVGAKDLKFGRHVKHIKSLGDKNKARNIGIVHASGDYILYLDHDMVASRKLLEDCLKLSLKYQAIIIPEKGSGGNFWQNCKKLEKHLIRYDIYTVTSRFYKKSIFMDNEEPFDSSLGLLDEWGFNNKLIKKRIAVGYSSEYVLVSENNFNLKTEVLNKFERGKWMNYFYKVDKDEAWRRVNPIRRGLLFYGKKLDYLFKDPLHFLGLIFLKTVDLASFTLGYVYVLLLKRRNRNLIHNVDIRSFYDEISGDYLKKMFISNRWNRFVDWKEKDLVKKIWNLDKDGNLNKQFILDLGMGPGRWSKLFLSYDFSRVYGLDISPKMVKKATKYVNSTKFFPRVGDISKLTQLFKNGYFDKIFCFRTFKYLDDPLKALLEIENVCKSGGSIIIEVSNKSILNILFKFFSKFMTDRSLNKNMGYFKAAKFYSQKEMSKLISEAGLEVESVHPLFVLPSIRYPSIIDRHLVDVMILIDNLLTKYLPSNSFARSWVFLIRKK